MSGVPLPPSSVCHPQTRLGVLQGLSLSRHPQTSLGVAHVSGGGLSVCFLALQRWECARRFAVRYLPAGTCALYPARSRRPRFVAASPKTTITRDRMGERPLILARLCSPRPSRFPGGRNRIQRCSVRRSLASPTGGRTRQSQVRERLALWLPTQRFPRRGYIRIRAQSHT